MGRLEIREYGSDFNLCLDEEWLSNNQTFFNGVDTQFFLSGRAALYALVEFGIKKYGWKTIYLPSFYCHDVTDYIESLSINIVFYNYNPYIDNTVEITNKDIAVLVKVDYYGFGFLDKITIKSSKIHVIEDLTHSLAHVKKSTADYGFASLRKELPVPTGGIVFSSKKLEIPTGEYYPKASDIAHKKLTAMYLKTMYLRKLFFDKAYFRSLYSKSENELGLELSRASNPDISNAVIKSLNITKILKAKNDNLNIVLEALRTDENVLVLNKTKISGFGLLLKTKTQKQRNQLKDYLIENAIYPSVLWPNQKTVVDKELERTILFIHIDFRYNKEQITKIVNTINLFFKN